MEKKIKKLIVGFFVMMLALTLLSRIAASAMVAKVGVTTGQSGGLSYEINGIGVVNANAKKYIELQSGYEIGSVMVKEGQQIEEGDVLFAYDLERLKEKKAELELELKKLLFSYEKQQLSDMDSSKGAELAKNNAEEDLHLTQKALEDAKETVKKDKNEALKVAKTAWENTVSSKKTAVNAADRAVADAEDELAELTKPQKTAQEVINNYKTAVISGDNASVVKVHDDIFEFYYNGKYGDHLQAVEEMKEKLKRAQEDLVDIQNKWDTAIDKWDQYSGDYTVKRAYQQQIISRDIEIKSADRTIEDIQLALGKLTQKDTQLDKALTAYNSFLLQSTPTYAGNVYDDLYKLLFDDLETYEKKLSAAETKLDRAKEDSKQTTEDWDKKVAAAYTEVEKLETDLKHIRDGSYNYQQDLQDKETGLLSAERGLESADLGLEKAENTDRAAEIDLNSTAMDIKLKKQELKQLNIIIKNNGEIESPVSGAVQTVEIEAGLTLSGQEKLVICTGGFELTMKANKDAMKSFAVEDEISIKTGEGQNKVTATIENIEAVDSEGNVSFTALLPEGEYTSGAAMDFELKKNSEDYDMCIPIQALRQDNRSAFVLIAKESDSVLGNLRTAFRLDVHVISQDANTAAVEASLSEEDLIIVSSSKNISEGDRVSVTEGE